MAQLVELLFTSVFSLHKHKIVNRWQEAIAFWRSLPLLIEKR
ncbi:hypothetical protein [Nostoc sp.]